MAFSWRDVESHHASKKKIKASRKKAAASKGAATGSEQKDGALRAVKETWVRTPVGYGVLLDTQDGMCSVELAWGHHAKTKPTVVHTPEKEALKSIELEVCTFYEDRAPFKMGCQLSETVAHIKEKIILHEALSVDPAELRLVVEGFELLPPRVPAPVQEQPLGMCRLSASPPFRLMYVLDQKSKFVWDTGNHGRGLQVVDGLTATMVTPCGFDDDSSIRGTLQISTGKVYWDILIQSCEGGRVNLGVCTENMNMNSYCGGDEYGWSYYGSNGHIEHQGASKGYGPTFGAGDTIRVLLDMEERTLSFHKNGTVLAVAYRNLPSKGVYPVVSMHAAGDSVTITKFGTFT